MGFGSLVCGHVGTLSRQGWDIAGVLETKGHKKPKICWRQQRHRTRQLCETMTRSEEEITRDEKLDMRVLVEYIRNDLFHKVKFVYVNDHWRVDGTIYKDYVKCCKGRIGRQTMTSVQLEAYMKNLWLTALTKKLQNKALVQKRSAIYTVMQNKFTGKCYMHKPLWCAMKGLSVLTTCCYERFV